MEFQVSFKVNEKIYLRDPEHSELGKLIVKTSIDLIHTIGFEQFTFKKLAIECKTTEATVYRYFENKHRLLLYIINWYWSYVEFLLLFQLQPIKDPKKKLLSIIQLLTHELPESAGKSDYNKKYLNQIVIAESSKVFLVKEVLLINKHQVFKPYKDLCSTIAEVIHANNPNYKYPKSLSSTLVESAHQQQFFCTFLPGLTDVQAKNKHEFTVHFLTDMVFKLLK